MAAFPWFALPFFVHSPTVANTWPQYAARIGVEVQSRTCFVLTQQQRSLFQAMRAVSTDDVVDSLLNSVASKSTPSPASSSDEGNTPSNVSPPSPSTNDVSRVSDASKNSTTAVTTPTTSSSSGSIEKTVAENSGSSGGSTALSIGIAIAVLALIAAMLFYLRSRRRRTPTRQLSTTSPPAGNACLTVPADRGFKKEKELGLPEISIELSPGELILSKGFDLSHTSSTRSSTASHRNPSIASSSDGSVFNTSGGVSPTFGARKTTNYVYKYSESDMIAAGRDGSTTFRLTGMVGNGNTVIGSNPSRAASRKLSTPDEYAELVSSTNANESVDMTVPSESPQVVHDDYTQGDIDRDTVMRVTGDSRPTVVRASEIDASSDSRHENQPDFIYDHSSRSSEEVPSTVTFLSGSKLSSSGRTKIPMLRQMSSDSNYGQEKAPDSPSTASTWTSRSGSLIALNVATNRGGEIAI